MWGLCSPDFSYCLFSLLLELLLGRTWKILQKTNSRPSLKDGRGHTPHRDFTGCDLERHHVAFLIFTYNSHKLPRSRRASAGFKKVVRAGSRLVCEASKLFSALGPQAPQVFSSLLTAYPRGHCSAPPWDLFLEPFPRQYLSSYTWVHSLPWQSQLLLRAPHLWKCVDGTLCGLKGLSRSLQGCALAAL